MSTVHKIPKFATEQEEAQFWDTHDAAEYLHETEDVDVTFIDARPKNQIALWFDGATLSRLEELAKQRGESPQAIIRVWVLEKLDQGS